ncbi:MAG TPA: rRNA adenine N(6)-methyltransferase family protein [Pseudonocardiaceae bacterium]
MAGLARSRRAWGWHPLVDEWAARIVADAGVRPGNLVLDIGAGRGALTRHLVDTGAKVIAVEPHPGRARWLRELFPTVTVVECDVLALRLPRRPFRVVANPPYSITSALLRHLLAPHSAMVAADLVLQRAVVRRHVEQPSRRWHLQAGLSLPRKAFRPPPQVDSAVLVVRRRHGSRRAP